jgi:hypothetical protein
MGRKRPSSICSLIVRSRKSVGGILNFVWDGSLQLMDRLVHGSLTHNLPFFTEAALIAAWELWKMRNDKVFQRQQPSPNVWLVNFKNQCYIHSIRLRMTWGHLFVFSSMSLVNYLYVSTLYSWINIKILLWGSPPNSLLPSKKELQYCGHQYC